VQAAVAAGAVDIIRRRWLATSAAPTDKLAAAQAGARVACITLARERGWWMPEETDARRHLSLLPHARAGTIGKDDVAHWTKPVAPASAHSLHESIEDALAHIAVCTAPEAARVLWESAIRIEKLSVEALRNVVWTTRAASELALVVTDLSDSGLESIFLLRLEPWGLPIRQQVILAGHPVDFLIGERLVVQVDGHAHHSSAADRGRDVRHDAELRLRGYTVLRFTYAQVLHDWPAVERAIARAAAAALHR
jgi:very-short-patch-repair endonuclease